ncbi:leucyl-tRNA synthetase, class Ia, archaeal/eukaryotic cytosolic [Staphylotrichum tortipilum]|uniref:leucine--tRNA ligase n=1 Tax=Staphylotrichum tortipilum TaxID=2831512 RepID=A0AAN6MM29_9PEZI|nr:leucyl-tRNA synthetase, class Ia, archaeal/eukaryotic cytosolic [Staphylotrichum longicolle]
MKIENTEKRDALRAIEQKYQKLWQDEKIFEADAPSCSEYPFDSVPVEELWLKQPKFFGTMAYPYVNGVPHLGHGFTVSKVDFATRVARAEGKNTLYPQGYHATGMPIKACADKLANEIAMFGQTFAGYTESDANEPAPAAAPVQSRAREDVTKFTNVKKSKAALKTTKAKYQFQVMLSLGIPREEIHRFADANSAAASIGGGIDRRRSFITADANGYYDSFVRWQMRRLRDLGKIRFGKRYTVYSPKDGQPCLDHDRSSGEGVLVQEYLALKCKVVRWSAPAQELVSASTSIPGNAEMFMIPATLRPETMYGQTNLFVSQTITYGVFKVSKSVFYVATSRAARNMAFQGIFPEWGTAPKVMEIKGSDLIGTLIRAPLSAKETVYIIPMDTTKETKGTGLVTSVPSDSPDDYAMTQELSKKAPFYGIDPDWICQDILPIIDTPEYGNTIAPALVKTLKINSPKDERQLAEAKELAYKTGFYQGTMVFGPFAGMPVQEAKNQVRQQLLDSGDAFVYCEPDGLVISRSGDECVAAFLDQWFLAYGLDEAWRDDTLAHLRGDDGQRFNCFSTVTKHSLEQTFGWMREWSVTRQYGLGTELPWDPSQMVEGLSDSTIYMAYYTVAHFLRSNIYGNQPGIGGVSVEQMTDGVWDYIFALADGVESGVPKATLDAMRREFTYCGKDLVNNHLAFFLYIHQATWGKQAPSCLPRAIRLNGHLMLNGEKMSKNTGNFLILTSAVQKFGADATRIALADGGDGIDDANFEETTANAAILKLYELKRWIENVIQRPRLLGPEEEFGQVRTAEKLETADAIQRTGPLGFWDSLFMNDMSVLIRQTVESYKLTNFKAALKSGFYDLTAARDSYRSATHSAAIGMHHDCVRFYAEAQALMLSIFAPHWVDYIWREVLLKPTTIQHTPFPSPPPPLPTLLATSRYIKTTTSRILTLLASHHKRHAKSKSKTTPTPQNQSPLPFDPTKPTLLTLHVALSPPTWKSNLISLSKEGGAAALDDALKGMSAAEMKKKGVFVRELKRKLETNKI